MNITIKPAILIFAIAVLLVLPVGTVVISHTTERRQSRTDYSLSDKRPPTHIIKLDTDTKNIKTFILACLAGAMVGVAGAIGHRIFPFVGCIVAMVLFGKLLDEFACLKYARQCHPAAYAASAVIFSWWSTSSLRKPIPGMERSHFFPKKWGQIFDSYTNKLNVSSVPVWYHNLTDRCLPRWAKNTVGLPFRAPPVVQVAVISFTRNSRACQVVSNWFRRNRG